MNICSLKEKINDEWVTCGKPAVGNFLWWGSEGPFTRRYVYWCSEEHHNKINEAIA